MKTLSMFLGSMFVAVCLSVSAYGVELPSQFVLPSADAAKLVYFAFSPDTKTIAVRGPDYIQLWNIADQTLIKTISNQRELPTQVAIKDMQFTPDGKNLVERFYAAPNIVVTSLDSEKVVFEKTLTGEDTYMSGYKFSPSGSGLLVYDVNSGYADILSLENWTVLSTTFIGIPPTGEEDDVISYAGFFFLDEENFLVEYFNHSTEDETQDFKLFKYKIGTTEISQIELPEDLSYTLQMSPTKYVARTDIINYAYDVSVMDITDKSVKVIYQNDFLPPDDSPKPHSASIDTLQYNAHNNVLLVGTTSFPSALPKGLRLIDMTTHKAFPSFDFNRMDYVRLYNNDKQNYIVGINRGKQKPEEAGIQFIKVGE